MTDNQRETFRIGSEARLEAQLTHEGRTRSCEIENVSAGGARISTDMQIDIGAACTLQLRFPWPKPGKNPEPWIDLDLAVLTSAPSADGASEYRLRSMVPAGAPAYERVAKLLYEAQRRTRALETGLADSSPMASDADRRSDLRPIEHVRFSRSSLRPDAPT